MANIHNKSNSTAKDEKKIFTKKEDNFLEWFREIVFDTKMLDRYDVSGCYIMLPYSYEMWEHLQTFMNPMFKSIGVQNAYFPLFITETNLNRESSHIDGFKAEVAWLDNKKEDFETNENHDNSENHDKQVGVRIAVRPTSECAFYPSFSKMIRTHADLPLKMNQWANVVRWEMTQVIPFIRGREFLWQEGHCAFSSNDKANENIHEILKIYEKIYNDILCVPVIVGKKVNSEKFAGADATYSLETFIPEAKKSIQCATAHNLGQNFSKMFDIKFQTKEGGDDFANQTSWGFTTRSIGTMVMTHSDNVGLVLPPRIAPIQIVIIPIRYISNKEVNDKIVDASEKLAKLLATKFRVHLDNSDKRPGAKYWQYEEKGVPLRIEIGPSDCQNNTITVVQRYNGAKQVIGSNESIIEVINNIMQTISKNMLDKATSKMYSFIKTTDSIDKFTELVEQGCLVSCTICDNIECENRLRAVHIKPICRPVMTNTLNCPIVGKCIICSDTKSSIALFSKTF
jgi:prolyl-tRNA synthetase